MNPGQPCASYASSLGVSSTGVQRSTLRASISQAGTSDSGVSGISVSEFRSQNSFQDLRNFCNAFNEPLLLAKDCIGEVDEDLLGGLGLLEAEASEMITMAQEVTLKLSLMARDCADLMQRFNILGGTTDAKQALLDAHNGISAVRKEAQQVRTRYIDLLEQVRYLDACTGVTLDQIIMQHLPEPIEGDAGLETQVPRIRPSPWQARMEDRLRTARAHFDGVRGTLEECSDFWLMIHGAELQMKKLEKEAAHLSTDAFQLNTLGGSHRLENFKEAMRFFTQEHAPMSSRSDRDNGEASEVGSSRSTSSFNGARRSYSGYVSGPPGPVGPTLAASGVVNQPPGLGSCPGPATPLPPGVVSRCPGVSWYL